MFVYSIYKALVEYKKTLKDKSKGDEGLTEKEENILKFISHTGSIYLMVTVISSIIEEIVEKKISSKFSISFKNIVELEDHVAVWKEIFPMILPLAPNTLNGAFQNKLKNIDEVKQAVLQLKGLVEVTRDANKEKYDTLKGLISFN